VSSLPSAWQKDPNLEFYAVGTILILLVTTLVLLFVFGEDDPWERKSKHPEAPLALDSETWQKFKLIEKESLSHDVRRFRFELPTRGHTLGLPIGQHISFKYSYTDEAGEVKEVQRSYTPTTSDDELGYVDFCIKVYFKGVNPRFPDGGKMSQHLDKLKIGDCMLMKGPKGHLDYIGRGKFTIKKTPKEPKKKYSAKKIGMIAGGTGITPMLQVIRDILKDPNDKTEIWLIFANQTEDDIFLRKELESIPKDRFHLWYTLDRPPAQWSFSQGFINKDMCKAHLPPPASDTMIFLCGPPPMLKFACEPSLKELGFDESQWFAF